MRSGLMPENSSRVLGSFAINFALPAMLFKSISEQPISNIFHWGYLLAYAVGSLFTFTIVFLIGRKFKGLGHTESAIYGMGSSFSNTLMIGFPITLQLFGDAALIPLALTLMVENFVMMPLTLTIAEAEKLEGNKRWSLVMSTLNRVMKNPIIIAIVLGAVVSAFNMSIPHIASDVVDMFAKTVSGVALFTIGCMLAATNLRGYYSQITMVLPSKLVLHPIAVFAAVQIIPGIDPLFASIAVILSALPMFGVFPIVASRFGLGAPCAGVLIPTTLMSFITLNIVILAVTP